MPSCYIIRGIPGSGKSTLADELGRSMNARICSADEYHTDNGIYRWKADNVPAAHAWCFDIAKYAMECGQSVIIDNTNTSEWEVEKYRDLALSFDYQVFVLVVENRHEGKNVHNVPEATLDKMRERLQRSIKL